MNHTLRVLKHTILIALFCSFGAYLSGCNTAGDRFAISSETEMENIVSVKELANNYPAKALLKTDSLLQTFELNEDQHSGFLQLLLLKANIFQSIGETDSAFAYLRILRSQAEALEIPEMVAESIPPLYYLSADSAGLNKNALYLTEAGKYFEKTGQSYKEGIVDILIAQMASYQKEFDKAEEKINDAINLLRETDSLSTLGTALLVKAEISKAQQPSPDVANNLFLEAADLTSKIENGAQKADLQIKLGNFLAKTDPEKAINLLQKAIEDAQNRNDFEAAGRLSMAIAAVHQSKKDLSKTEKNLLSAITLFEKTGKESAISEACRSIGILYKVQGKYALSSFYLQKAFMLYPSRGKRVVIQKELIDTYEKAGNTNKAYEETKRLLANTDSFWAGKNGGFPNEKNNAVSRKLTSLENKLLKQNLKNEQLKLLLLTIIILLLVLSFVGVIYLFRQRTLILRERNHAYQVLLARYKNEKPATGHKQEERPKSEKTEPEEESTGKYNPVLQALLDYFDQEAPYLDSKLKIETVAKRLNTTQKNVNQLLKDYDNLSFPYFVNRYRVVAAMKMLEDPDKLNLKIEAIASDAGFGSKQSFYSSFENITGIKPTYYRSQMMSFNENEENNKEEKD